MSRKKGQTRKLQVTNSVNLFEHGMQAYSGTDSRQGLRVQKYLKLINMLAVSRFSWINLPAGVDERYLEMTLYQSGSCILFPHKQWRRFVVSPSAMIGANNYNNPTKFQPTAQGLNVGVLDSHHAVPIWDNPLRSTMIDVMADYASRLAAADRALDVNLDNLSIPLIIACPESQRTTVQRLMQARNEGAPYVYTTDTLSPDDVVKSIPNVTPNLTKDLLTVKEQIWNEMCTFLGIATTATEKRERLVAAEAEYNTMRSTIYRESYLKCRQQACDTANMLWFNKVGKPIGVRWNDWATTPDLHNDVDYNGGGGDD